MCERTVSTPVKATERVSTEELRPKPDSETGVVVSATDSVPLVGHRTATVRTTVASLTPLSA